MYYELAINPDFEVGCNLEDYELGEFDLTKFWKLGNLEGNEIADLQIDISSGEVSDYLSPPISLPIVSQKFKLYIEKWNDKINFVKLDPALRKVGVDSQYYLMEFKSTMKAVKGIKLGLDIFRAENEGSGSILFSEAAAKGMKLGDFKGIAFIEYSRF